MKEWFGRHPVIHLDFSLRTSINSYQDAVNHCRNVVREAFKQHSYLRNSTKWKYGEDEIIREYCDDVEFQKPQQSKDRWWFHDVFRLIVYLFQHFGRKCIILMDEYDAIFRASLASTDKDTFIKIKRLYEGFIDYPIHNFATSNKIDTVVLSGISPMAIYGTRDLDRLRMCAFLRCDSLRDDKLLDFHGFTQLEFDSLMEKHNISADTKQQASEYYNGYCWMKNRDEKFYNPYSVAQFLKTKVIQAYWSNSEFFEKNRFLLNFKHADLIIKQLIFEPTFKTTVEVQPMNDYVIENLHNKNSEDTDYLIACLYDQGYLQTVDHYGTNHWGDHDMLVKVANKEAKISLIEELKKYYKTCGKFDWYSLEACAKHFDNIDFTSNPDLRKIYSLLEKYCCGFFTMNEESISEVHSYESESIVIEQYFRRLLYNVASLTKHKTTIIDPGEYPSFNFELNKRPIDKITPDLKMCSNHGCIVIQAKYDTTAQEALNQLILHSCRDETIKYLLIGLNLSKDKRFSMSAKIGDDFFTYGSEDSS